MSMILEKGRFFLSKSSLLYRVFMSRTAWVRGKSLVKRLGIRALLTNEDFLLENFAQRLCNVGAYSGR